MINEDKQSLNFTTEKTYFLVGNTPASLRLLPELVWNVGMLIMHTKSISPKIKFQSDAALYLRGNEAVRPVFEEMKAPYKPLDFNNLTIQNTNYTDHDVFDYYKIPGFQLIQDMLNYQTGTHHTNLDALEYVPERDVMVNATEL